MAQKVRDDGSSVNVIAFDVRNLRLVVDDFRIIRIVLERCALP